MAIRELNVEIASLRSELGARQQRLKTLRPNLPPQLQAEYAQLRRAYDVNSAQYAASVARLEKARVRERAERR